MSQFSIQIVTWFVAISSVVVSAWLARSQRRAEFRWRRVEKAQQLIDAIHAHFLAHQAVHMLDWYDSQIAYKYNLKGGDQVSISYDKVINVLKLPRRDCKDETYIFIQDCFDWFFYFVDRIAHSINRRLIDRVDVDAIFRPYARILGEDWPVFESFMSSRQYELAKNFFRSYSEFKDSQLTKAASAAPGP